MCIRDRDRHALKTVDWGLLATFAAFFSFSGNLARMEAVHILFARLLSHGTMLVSALTCQIISNVPATLLLADFTHNLKNLTIGVNLGGLGTLIASMASLISYKIYAHNYNKTKGRYLLWFTIANVLFLAVLVLVYVFIS